MKDIGKPNIFEFNHIDKSLSESDVTTLKDFYKHYHKKYWCFKKSYKRYKLLDETLTLSGGGLVVIGTITGGITLNPIVFGCNKWRRRSSGKYCKNEELQEKD